MKILRGSCLSRSTKKLFELQLTSVRKLNSFWQDHIFSETQEPLLYKIRSDFSEYVDGFSALCAMIHAQRNIVLCHLVAKMPNNPKGCTKRGYLNSLQRALKMYERQMQLSHIYGEDWSWANSEAYRDVRKTLKVTTIQNEMKLEPSKSKTLAEFMNEEQFQVLHNYTWDSAQRSDNVVQKLTHFIRYLIQGILVYACLRARDEIAFCEVDEFSIIDERTIKFQMKRDFKSMKLDAHYNVVHKPPR